MKPCVKCKAELPDSAGHCVYCGSKQASPLGPQNKSTMMGHPGLVSEMLKNSVKAPPGQSFDGHMTPTKLSVPPEQRARLDEAARAAGLAQTAPQQAFAAAPQQQQPYGAPPQQQPYGAPPQQQQNPYGAPPQQPPYATPPGQPQQPYATPAQQQPYGAPPGMPSHGGQSAPPFGGANLGIQNAQFGSAAQQQQAYGRAVPDAYRDSLTEQVKPLRAPGHSGRLDEWDESLTTQLLVFGVLLVACFVAPWSVAGGETSFSWTVLSSDAVPFSQKLTPILLAGTGILAVLMGAFKLAPSARALAAAGIGLTPIVVQVASSKPFAWQLPVGTLGMLLLVTGLVIRSRHTISHLGRVMATIGMLAIVAIYLVPDSGAMLIKELTDGLANLPGKAKVMPLVGTDTGGLVIGLLPLFLAILALLVWLPGPSRAGTHILSWVHIFWGLLAAVVALVLGAEIVASLKGNLSGIIYLPLAGAAWLTLAAFGIAGVVSNQVES